MYDTQCLLYMCRGSSVVEREPEELSVGGSIPSPGTIFLEKFKHICAIACYKEKRFISLCKKIEQLEFFVLWWFESKKRL